MKSNSSLTQNQTASDTIAAVIQVLIFVLENSFIFFFPLFLINIIGNESGDKSNVTYNWGPQKSRFAKRGPQSSRFTKKGVRKAKSLGTSGLNDRADFCTVCHMFDHMLMKKISNFSSIVFANQSYRYIKCNFVTLTTSQTNFWAIA